MLSTLYAKIDSFLESQPDELKNKSACQKGCSRCCYTDLSVFEAEASHIRQWFQSLSRDDQQIVRSQWMKPQNSMENFRGEQVSSCVFLRDEACTIYEARPLICRTQGLPLKFKDGSEVFLDVCPLNESLLENIQGHHILNLDLLNHILSRIEHEEAQGTHRSRVLLKDLQLDLKANP